MNEDWFEQALTLGFGITVVALVVGGIWAGCTSKSRATASCEALGGDLEVETRYAEGECWIRQNERWDCATCGGKETVVQPVPVVVH